MNRQMKVSISAVKILYLNEKYCKIFNIFIYKKSVSEIFKLT